MSLLNFFAPEPEPISILEVLKPSKELPDESFIKGELQKNEAGDVFTDNEKNLHPTLYGLFHSYVIRDFKELPNQNHIYTGGGLNSEKQLRMLKTLVNAFFDEYAADDQGKGKLELEDITDIREDVWTGRNWFSPSKKYPAMISYSIQDGVQLSIWITD